MLGWISQKFQDFRIAWERGDYERSAREAHIEDAERRFDTTAIELRAEELMAPYVCKDQARFGEAITKLEFDARTLRLKRSTEKYQLSLLKRAFAAELSLVHRGLDDLNVERRNNVEQHREALEELREVQSEIDWWYRKSNCYLIDRGRSIPERRIFGSDKNDLERLKSTKAELKEKLEVISSDIDKITGKISTTKERVRSLKGERERAQRLKRDGASIFSLSHSIGLAGNALVSNDAEATKLKTESAAFLANARIVSGAQALLDEAKALQAQKVAFLEEFDCQKAQQARIVAHRQHWIKARTN